MHPAIEIVGAYLAPYMGGMVFHATHILWVCLSGQGANGWKPLVEDLEVLI
jgi:hypothetical protein